MTVAAEAPAAPVSPARPQRSLGERLIANPIVRKELRGRMRGNRAFVVISIYLTLLSIFTLLLYMAYAASSQSTLSPNQQVVGKIVFGGVVGIELFLVCFIAPAFTAGAISGERERQTYDLLRTTLLPARSLVSGKLIAALSFIVLLLFAAVPLQSMAFLLGGVAIEEVLISLAVLLATAVGFGSVGIFFSAIMQRTLGASVLTYAVALFATLGLPLLLLIALPLFDSFFFSANSPSVVLEGILIYFFYILISLNPLATVIATEYVLVEEQTAFFFSYPMNSSSASLPLASPWLIYVVVYLMLSLVLVWLAVRVVRRVQE